jgi:CheY-like chemotaxis protein
MNVEILKNVKILFIEDDDVQRNELFTFLKRRVQKVYTAQNGEEGYQKYLSMKPDIILTDLRMPRVDGLELVEMIRKENRLIPIIVTTAMNDKETILKSIDVGITNYIVKPVNTNELLVILVDSVKTILAINQDEFDSFVDKEKVNDLKNTLTKYLKVTTGKGPQDIRVVLSKVDCEIYFQDCLTLYEKALLQEKKNIQLINHNRNIFFEDRINELETMINETLQLNYIIKEIKSNVSSDEILLKLKLQ